ncbi:MAG: gamma-glutamyl-gamma-aminobutyrate hydrolase family protein [Anaerolineaceae bacterium]|mgnify:CR=1 FL=1|jgi:putative glutamine amidotransferase|nr:gamma-glutamyl-gamma-aminobutyrate hydrolase family protein [Anaerolineaceae bacterium]
MQKPRIGIPSGRLSSKEGSPYFHSRQVDIAAVLNAGAVTLLLPALIPLDEIPDLVGLLDGFYLTGGADLDPSLYAEQPHESVYGVDPLRDAFELALIREVIAQDKPLLAVCRGAQTLNVACGGTLYVDIASQLPQANKHDWFPSYERDKLVHDVQIEAGSKLHQLLGVAHLRTNSLHHQAIRQLGEGLRAVAWAEDGVIEAVEHRQCRFVLGVQWHPEWLQDQEPMRALYQGFVQACSDNKRL